MKNKVSPKIYSFLLTILTLLMSFSYVTQAKADYSRFPLGHGEVTAQVYTLFLQEKAKNDTFSFFYLSKYYDSSFMSTDRIIAPSSENLTLFTQQFNKPNTNLLDITHPYLISYEVIPGYEQAPIQ